MSARRELFWCKGGEFRDFDDWVNHASSYLGRCLPRGTITLCVDAKGRPCNIGYDFHRARDEGAFPVTYYLRVVDSAGLHEEIRSRNPDPTRRSP